MTQSDNLTRPATPGRDDSRRERLPATRTLTLFVMSERGYEVLRALADEEPECLAAVVAARDPGVQKDWFDEIAALCAERRIPFVDRFTPVPDEGYALTVGWRWLNKWPEERLIVLHDSLLPRYRGFAPLVAALINGDAQVGVTALLAAEAFDEGPIVSQEVVDIHYPIKAVKAIRAMIPAYVALATRIARTIASGEALAATPQDESLATWSLWRDDEDYQIDWSMAADRIERFVDAVGYPYRGASTLVNDTLARVLAVKALPDLPVENRTPGKVLFVRDGRPIVVCGSGLLRIDELLDEQDNSLLPLSRFRTRFR
jgi:methionyl-tRNA formyltransferase